MRESYVEGTTFSGGLLPYVFNHLVDVMVSVGTRPPYYVEGATFSGGVLHIC